MRILILSFYYPPDLSAGSFRTAALVNSLLAQLPEHAHIDVITTQPNRYHALAQSVAATERTGRLTIRRIELPPHRSGMRDQARAFLAYARGVSRLVEGQAFDLIFATSSRLLTAFLGARLTRKRACPLYLDIRDIFVDTMDNVLPRAAAILLHPLLSLVERYTMRSARRINLVSGGFLPYFQSRYPAQRFDTFTNGIDEEFITHAWQTGSPRSHGAAIKVLYAGNIGEGQGLHKILPQLAQACAKTHQFLVVGDGGKQAALANALAQAGVRNVELHKPVRREELMALYQDADVLFLHLNDYAAFRKVLPSKLFEYAATGKPILAGVAGYAADFLGREVADAAVFAPCDAQAGLAALQGLRTGQTDRSGFVSRFRRTAIMHGMANTLLTLAAPHASTVKDAA